MPVAAVVQFLTDHLQGLEEPVDQTLVAAGVKAKLGTHRLATVERRVAALSVCHPGAKCPPLPPAYEDTLIREPSSDSC